MIVNVDPGLGGYKPESLNEQVAGAFSQQRLIAYLTSLFGLLALLLASIGLYGVTTYNMGLRMKEIGVRIALGAGQHDVLALVLREGFVLIASGLLLGVPLAVMVGRYWGGRSMASLRTIPR